MGGIGPLESNHFQPGFKAMSRAHASYLRPGVHRHEVSLERQVPVFSYSFALVGDNNDSTFQ